MFPLWIKEMIGERSSPVIAMDWTSFGLVQILTG
jgi:hypothetical protein